MNELEDKFSAILNNPQMMQQIMALAQNITNSQSEAGPQLHDAPASPHLPDIDTKLIQKLTGMLKQGGIDRNQTALLSALSPYLGQDRIHRLERAMHAAKIAAAASTFLGSGGLQLLGGR